jgi:uncharacterized RDD family membrane protein YckC
MDDEQTAPVPTAPAQESAPAGAAAPVGFWVRCGAALIDGIVGAAAGFLVGGALRPVGAPPFLVFVIQLGLSAGYHTFFVAEWGATLGKMAAGAEIVGADGGRLSYARALGRFFAQYLSLFVLGLGYVMAAFTENKRALHDYIVDSRVIYKPDVGAGRRAAMAVLGVTLFAVPFALGVSVAMSSRAARAFGGRAGGGTPSVSGFDALIQKSEEGADKGNLGALRSGLAIYYGDKEGLYPADLRDLVPKYVPQIPVLKLPGRPETSGVEYYDDDVCSGPKGDRLDATKLRDSGKWGYVRPRPGASQGQACVGTVFVDSKSPDTQGHTWGEY